MNTVDYSDEQMRQELISFFGWRVKDVRRLTVSELTAWKRHALALRRARFWWFSESGQDLGTNPAQQPSS